MKLKIRYDETVQTLDLDEKATEQLWVSLSLEGEDLSDSEKEQKIQEAFDVQYNRPEYNNMHKFDRHRGNSKAQPVNDNGEEDAYTSEPLCPRLLTTGSSAKMKLTVTSAKATKQSVAVYARF